MAESAVQVFEAAENQLRAGKFDEALGSYLRVIRGVPEFYRARFRVADTLLNFKARKEALDIYVALAWHGLKAGHPLPALVSLKMAILLDAQQKEVIDVLASLYCRGSDRVTSGNELPRRRLKKEDAAGSIDGLSGAALLQAAAKEAADLSALGNYPEQLPAIPLFSYLDEEAFAKVLTELQLRRFVKGNKIIQEGAAGDSFFILAEGDVEVVRQVGDKTAHLARLHAGSVFGEMALISKAPRTATVVATDDCDLLELKRASLESQAAKLESVTKALHDFTHDRFLNNLTSTSPVFRPFPRDVRLEIIKKFQDFPVDPGDELIGEGEMGQGLFLVLKGTVEVSKKGEDGKAVSLAKLKEGDVFGEISLIQDSPTTATVTAVTRGMCLFLPKKDFAAALKRHPELQDTLSKLTAERLKHTKDMLNPEEYELIEDDDLIML